MRIIPHPQCEPACERHQLRDGARLSGLGLVHLQPSQSETLARDQRTSLQVPGCSDALAEDSDVGGGDQRYVITASQ